MVDINGRHQWSTKAASSVKIAVWDANSGILDRILSSLSFWRWAQTTIHNESGQAERVWININSASKRLNLGRDEVQRLCSENRLPEGIQEKLKSGFRGEAGINPEEKLYFDGNDLYLIKNLTNGYSKTVYAGNKVGEKPGLVAILSDPPVRGQLKLAQDYEKSLWEITAESPFFPANYKTSTSKDGTVFYVQQFCKGGTLEQKINSLSPEEKKRVAQFIIKAIR